MQLMPDNPALDLNRLREMHPRLPPDVAESIKSRAALGLQRNQHSTGVNLHMAIDSDASSCPLLWSAANLDEAEVHDHNRITEDGAEAIALAVAHRTKTWQVVRRGQSKHKERGDWVLEHVSDGKRRRIVLEVSGVDRGSISARVREKLAQVAKSPIHVFDRCAAVVGFERPEASLKTVKKKAYGR